MPPPQRRERYADGSFKDTRASTDKAYRQRQRQQRAWVAGICSRLGIESRELLDYPAESVADLIRFHLVSNNNKPPHRKEYQSSDRYHRATTAGNPADWIIPEELLTFWDAKGIPALECYITGAELTPQNRSIDHVVAISNGGSHTVDNLMPCTLEANLRKNDMTPEASYPRGSSQ